MESEPNGWKEGRVGPEPKGWGGVRPIPGGGQGQTQVGGRVGVGSDLKWWRRRGEGGTVSDLNQEGGRIGPERENEGVEWSQTLTGGREGVESDLNGGEAGGEGLDPKRQGVGPGLDAGLRPHQPFFLRHS